MLTNIHDSKRKSMSEVMASPTQPPTKKTTQPSPSLVPEPTTSMTYSTEDIKPLASYSNTNIPLRPKQEPGQQVHVEGSKKSVNHDPNYQGKAKDKAPPPRGRRATNGRGTQVNGSQDTNKVRKIRVDIARTEAKMREAKDKVAELDKAIQKAEAEFLAFVADYDLGYSLANPNARFPWSFDCTYLSKQEAHAHHLRSRLQELKEIRTELACWASYSSHTSLNTYKQQLDQALSRQMSVRNVVKTSAVVIRESGIFYLPHNRRIGVVEEGSSSDIGLVEMEEDERVHLKDIIVVGDFSRLLDPAWMVRSYKVHERCFFNELVRLFPSLSKDLLENAWLALTMHYERKYDTNGNAADDNISCQQQGVYLPFTMLLMAATADYYSVNASFKTGQNVYSSLSIAYEQTPNDGTFHERKLTVMPTAAATLYQGWDVFGMMEIQSNDGIEMIEYDRCVLMTSVTAMALKQCIRVLDYRKVALPFIIWSGYKASLYVTRLDQQGNPIVSTVGYPTCDDGSLQDLSESPSAARTKLFLAFAALLNEFKTFFENSVEISYHEQVQKCITLLESVPEYTPGGCI